MSLRQRTLLVTIVGFSVLILVTYFVLTSVVMTGFVGLEAENVTDNIQRTRNVMDRELQAMGVTVTDWAFWDDTYQFIEDRNADYLDANLMDSTFTSLSVNFIVFADREGDIVYAKGYDLGQAAEMPVPASLVKHLVPDHPLFGQADSEEGAQGLLLLPEGTLLVVSRPILTSEGDGPSHGVLVFGRYLDDSFVQSLADMTLTDASIFRMDEALPADVSLAKESLTGPTGVFVKPLDGNTVAGYTTIRDIHDQPALILKLESQRQIVQSGRRSLQFGMIAIVVVLVTGALGTWLLLEKEVISRVAALAAQVRHIGLSGDPARRISLTGGDEVSGLATDVNHMLDSLQKVRQAHRESEERQDILSRIVTDYTYVAAVGANDRLETVWSSPGFSRLLGTSSAEEFFAGLQSNEAEDGRRMVQTHIEHLLAGSEDVVVVHFRDSAGHERWLRSYGQPIKDVETGRVARIYGAVHDITDQRQAEEERQVLNDLYLQAQKMETVGRLTAGIAHDFNNVLTVINGFSELLQTQVDETSPHRELVDRIAASGTRAAALVRQLMAFSRKVPPEPKLMNLNAQIVTTETMLHRIIGEDVTLETVLAADLWPVRADPVQVEQIIMNLATNARDAMPKGGRLSIRTSNLGAAGDAQPPRRPGQYVLLSIRDTGIGMDYKVQSRAFQPFFTTKEKGKGTGLGLATVFNIVDQHGGFVWLDSAEGRGTTVEIYLPRAQYVPQPVSIQERTRVPAADLKGTETVLLVEDDEPVREAACKTLERFGYTVETAVDGPSALRLFEVTQGDIDLVLTDLVMPVMSGQDMVSHMRHMRPDVKVVFMTGYDQRIADGLTGAFEKARVVTKPFSMQTLARAVRETLDGEGSS